MIKLLRRFVAGTARLYHVHLRIPAGLVVILQRSRYVEKAKASEHRPFHRHYDQLFANRFGVDAERNPDGVH